MRILNKRLLTFFCFFFMAGIFTANLFQADLSHVFWIALISVGIAAIIWFATKKLLFCILILSFCLGNFLFANQLTTDFKNINNQTTYTITGRICDYPDLSSENARYILGDVTLTDGQTEIQFPKRVLLRTPDKSFAYGDIVTFSARVFPPAGETMPKSFNNRIYLAAKYVGFSAYSEDTVKTGYRWMPYEIFVQSRKALEQNIENTHSAQTAPVAKAIFLGIMNEIPEEVTTSFASTGIVHILSISGLHISAVVLIINLLLGKLRLKRNKKFLFSIAALLLYTSITGFPISVIRSALMAIFILVARWRFADRDLLIFLSGAMLLTLLFNPAQLFMPGFLLSYGSVFGILCLYPLLVRPFQKKKDSETANEAEGMLCVSVSATVSTFPMTAYYFNNVTLISPLTNFIAIPISTLILAATGLSAIGAFISLTIGKFFAFFSESLIKFLIIINNTISEARFGFLKVYSFSIGIGIAVFSAIFILSDYFMISIKKKLLFCVLALGIAVLPVIFPASSDGFKIVFLDVGYGEAVHIQCNDKNILLSNGTDAAAYNIINYSNQNGVRYDLFILTESSPSHLSSAAEIIGSGAVKDLFICQKSNEELSEVCVENGIQMQYAKKYDTLWKDEAVEITVLQDSYTALSLMVEKDDSNLCLLSGHSAKRSEDISESAPVMRLASEGNENSLNQPFLSRTNPEYVVISTYESNRYGLPDENVLQLLANKNIKTYRTDTDYTITMTVDKTGNIVMRTMNED